MGMSDFTKALTEALVERFRKEGYRANTYDHPIRGELLIVSFRACDIVILVRATTVYCDVRLNKDSDLFTYNLADDHIIKYDHRLIDPDFDPMTIVDAMADTVNKRFYYE
jgi:hypothetical protein